MRRLCVTKWSLFCCENNDKNDENTYKITIYFCKKYGIIRVPSQLNIFYWINDFIINLHDAFLL